MTVQVVNLHDKVKNLKYYEDKYGNRFEYIGRAIPFKREASKWHNRFKEGRDGTRLEVVAKHRTYLLGNKELIGTASAFGVSFCLS